MLPRGLIWQLLRQRALTTIPEGTRIAHASPPTLQSWLEVGAFSVNHTAPRVISLTASSHEIGGALFAEAAFHLDHAAEHSATVRNQLSSGDWYSAAWLVVTFYYWAFFLVLSITRMLGKTGWFLTRGDSARLRHLGGAGAVNSGSGPFVLECGPVTSLSQRDVALKKAKITRLHDLIWRLWFDDVEAFVAHGISGGTDQEELRLYSAIKRSADLLGTAWPAELRNLVNYAPGVGYGAVRRKVSVNVFGTIQYDPASTFDTTLNRLEHNVASYSTALSAPARTALATKLLIDLTFTLDALARGIHEEVIERRYLDRRWSNWRDEFLQLRFDRYGTADWPYST